MSTKSGHRVLVLEDEPAIGRVFRKVLAQQGFEVDIACNGKEAQSIVDRQRHVLCLIDIRMPEMNGKEFYQWLANKHCNLAENVIFTTGDVMDQQLRNFIRGTGRPFLPKPFTPDGLKSEVQKSLRMNRKGRLVTTSNRSFRSTG